MGGHPFAVMEMENGAEIVMELLPDAAPNTVASFAHLAAQGCFDGYAIQRIVPGKWVDVSYRAFGRPACRYLIPRESELHPEIAPLPSDLGCVCMGGYAAGLAGGEFFFPLKPCPEHLGVYPVFGRIRSGLEEILRIAALPTRPVQVPGLEGIEINEPLQPQIIRRVSLEWEGLLLPPVKLENAPLPANWR